MRWYLKVIEFTLRDHVIELPHVCPWDVSNTDYNNRQSIWAAMLKELQKISLWKNKVAEFKKKILHVLLPLVNNGFHSWFLLLTEFFLGHSQTSRHLHIQNVTFTLSIHNLFFLSFNSFCWFCFLVIVSCVYKTVNVYMSSWNFMLYFCFLHLFLCYAFINYVHTYYIPERVHEIGW